MVVVVVFIVVCNTFNYQRLNFSIKYNKNPNTIKKQNRQLYSYQKRKDF